MEDKKYNFITQVKDELDKVQLVCVLWFTLETFTRFMTCADKKTFLKSAANIVDILSVLPVYVMLMKGGTKGCYFHVFFCDASYSSV